MRRELVTADLADAWTERFESLPPVRTPRAFKGHCNFAGSWWFATTQTHAPFESWLERDHLTLLDFAPDYVTRVWVRNHHQPDAGWITLWWRQLASAPVPFGEDAWTHARNLIARRGRIPVHAVYETSDGIVWAWQIQSRPLPSVSPARQAPLRP